MVKFIGRYDKHQKMFRLVRLVWHNKKEKEWLSKKITIALQPKLYKTKREYKGLIVCILGVRIHYKTSYGGYMVWKLVEKGRSDGKKEEQLPVPCNLCDCINCENSSPEIKSCGSCQECEMDQFVDGCSEFIKK